MFRVGIGQDSHAFEATKTDRVLVLGGVDFETHVALEGNSDADVVLHALTNAVSGVTGVNVIGLTSDAMCKNGVVDSRKYLQVALQHLGSARIVHVSVAIECSTPRLEKRIDEMKRSIGGLLGLAETCVGITATSGEGLTAFGRGEGVQAICIVTVECPSA